MPLSRTRPVQSRIPYHPEYRTIKRMSMYAKCRGGGGRGGGGCMQADSAVHRAFKSCVV